MVIEFLNKIYSEYLEEKLELESEISRTTISLNQNMKYIEKLKKEYDENFDVFSPRKQNLSMRNNINNLQEEYDKLLLNLENYKKRLADIDCKIDEINLVLKNAKIQKSSREIEKESLSKNIYESCVENLSDIEHKIKLCSTLLEVDPIRCKLEICSVSQMISNTIEQMKGITL